jgi:hypothetical protein
MKLLTKIALTGVGLTVLMWLAMMYPAPAQAACTVTPVGVLQFYSNCSSDNQANDGDDIKMFVDKTPRTTSVIDGSLGSNNQAFVNIVSTANADFETDGSGFANFKSVDAGSTANTLTAYLFAPGPSPTLPDGTAFAGFDGELFRGQIDNTGSYNGDLFVRVTLADGTMVEHLYTGLSDKNDFGVLGFDEQPGVDELVRSVFISVNSDGASGGAWNEFKQIEMSVPGAIAVIPEPRTWAMMLIGFGLVGLMGYRRALKRSALAASAQSPGGRKLGRGPDLYFNYGSGPVCQTPSRTLPSASSS